MVAMSGNSSTAGGPDTRARLIGAARRLFAERGYAATSTRMIAREAGVNLGGIQYHFGSKQELHRHVLEDVFSPGLEQIEAASRRDGPVEERLAATIRATFQHLWDNPDQAAFTVAYRLFQVEMLPEVARHLAPLTRSLVALMEEGQAQHRIRAGDPLLLAMSVMSQPLYFMLITRRTPPSLLPLDPTTPEGREAYVEHMVGFTLRGLQPDEEAT
jgi:AcrR family transcriptional regulator